MLILARAIMIVRDDGSSPAPEDRGADANMRCAELDRDGEVGAHTHRQLLQAIARGDFCGQRKVRRRRLVDRRDAHHTGDREPVGLPARRNETVRLGRSNTRFLCFLASVELYEQLGMPVLGLISLANAWQTLGRSTE